MPPDEKSAFVDIGIAAFLLVIGGMGVWFLWLLLLAAVSAVGAAWRGG